MTFIFLSRILDCYHAIFICKCKPMLVVYFTAELTGENGRFRVITLAIVIRVNATKLITIIALQALDCQIVRIRGPCKQHKVVN